MSENSVKTLSNNAESNSSRFLAAYNAVDKSLRRRFHLNPHEGFSEAVRKSAGQSFVVKKYAETLLEFARLRNAIVHGDTGEAIAEPHDCVTEEIERLSALIAAPPLALNKIAKREVITVRGEASLKDAMFLLRDKSRSHLPVISDGAVTGIINGKILVTAIADAFSRKSDLERFLKITPVKKILPETYSPRLFEILPRRASIEDAADLFAKNRKLKLILITGAGGAQEKILGVVTVADIAEFNNLLFD